MEITINIPDEAIERISNGMKYIEREAKRKAGKDVKFDSDGIDFIQEVLQAYINNIYHNTNPKVIQARLEAKRIQDEALKESTKELKK